MATSLPRGSEAETVLHELYKQLGRKGDGSVTVDLIDRKGGRGPKKELTEWSLRLLNVTVDCMKLLKSGCVELLKHAT